MKQNPTPPPLTGASIDRAAHLRDDPDALARMAADPAAQTVVFSNDQTLFRLTRNQASRLRGGPRLKLKGMSRRFFSALTVKSPAS